jgi:ribosomal protein S27E
MAHAVFAAVCLLCVALLVCPPGQFSFYPVCPIHRFFDIDCPGCGATRALTALLHGNVLEALRLNALFVLLLPALLAGSVESYRRALRPGNFRWPQPPAPAMYATLAAAAVFTIVRNVIR